MFGAWQAGAWRALAPALQARLDSRSLRRFPQRLRHRRRLDPSRTMRLVAAARRSQLPESPANSAPPDRRPPPGTRVRRSAHRHAPPKAAHVHQRPSSAEHLLASCAVPGVVRPRAHRRTLVSRRRFAEPSPCVGRRRTRRHTHHRPERPPAISFAAAATLPESLPLLFRPQPSVAAGRRINHSDPPAPARLLP